MMRYIWDNDLHIHSKLSLCSNDEEQTPERILQYAKDNHLSTICLTDHCWDDRFFVKAEGEFYSKQNCAHIQKAKPLPQAEGIRFLFGCEAEMDKEMHISIDSSRYEELDFIVVPINHFHFVNLTIPEDMLTVPQRAEFWLTKFHALLDQELPFHKVGLAHLTCGLMAPTRQECLGVIKSWNSDDLKRVFEKAAKKGVGIELNSDDMSFSESEAEVVLRPYRIAKQVGCKFYMGSDAHHPDALWRAKEVFERAIDLLQLTEDDKFMLR